LPLTIERLKLEAKKLADRELSSRKRGHRTFTLRRGVKVRCHLFIPLFSLFFPVPFFSPWSEKPGRRETEQQRVHGWRGAIHRRTSKQETVLVARLLCSILCMPANANQQAASSDVIVSSSYINTYEIDGLKEFVMQIGLPCSSFAMQWLNFGQLLCTSRRLLAKGRISLQMSRMANGYIIGGYGSGV
jgi:hypothetical protein